MAVGHEVGIELKNPGESGDIGSFSERVMLLAHLVRECLRRRLGLGCKFLHIMWIR